MSSLEEVLARSQRVGLIGPTALRAAIEHADRFVRALPPGPGRLVDLGSGGGLPGLVIAARRSDLHVTLVDRKGRACDVLRRAVVALGAVGRVLVVEEDASVLGRDPGWRAGFDAVTARGFGPPALVAEFGVPLLRPGGRLVVSALGEGAGWSDDGLAMLGAHVLSRDDGLVVVEAGECPDRYPRLRPTPALW